MSKKISKNGLEFLKTLEGVVSYEYLCGAGKPTISKGIRTDLLDLATLNAYTELREYDDIQPISLNGILIQPNVIAGRVRVVTASLENDFIALTLKMYEKCVNDVIKRELTQNEFDALVSFVYNIGVSAFAKSSIVKEVNANAEPKSLLKWNKVNGQVSAGLMRRRQKELAFFLKK